MQDNITKYLVDGLAVSFGVSKELRSIQPINFKEVDKYICNGNPSVEFEKISQKYKSTNRCNSVYPNEHYGFRCKQCGLTETSCMCLECFDPNNHIGHDYVMYHANVGGCCDCGDVCWSQNTWCERHRVKKNPEPFPPDLQERSKLVLDTICEYIYFYLYSISAEIIPDTATPVLKSAIEYVNKIVSYSSNFAVIVQKWFNSQTSSPDYIIKHEISTSFNNFRHEHTNLDGILYSLTKDKCNDLYLDSMSDLLLSLLDKPWKAIFTPCFTNHYFDFIKKMSHEIGIKQKNSKYVSNSYEAYSTNTEVFLDRIVCQLFNDPESDDKYLLRNGFLDKISYEVIEYFKGKYRMVYPNSTLFDKFELNAKSMLALDYDSYKELTHDRIFSDFLMLLGETETFNIYVREEGVMERLMDIVYYFHFTDPHQFIPSILRIIPANRRSTFDENFPLIQVNSCRTRLTTQFEGLYEKDPEIAKEILVKGIKRIVENIRRWNKEHCYWNEDGMRNLPITILKCSSNLALNTILSTLISFFSKEEIIKIIKQLFTEFDCNLIEIMCVRFFAYYYQVLSSLWPRNVDLQELIPYYNDQYYCECVLLSTFFTLQIASSKVPANTVIQDILKVFHNQFSFRCDVDVNTYKRNNKPFTMANKTFTSYLLEHSHYDNVDMTHHNELALFQLYFIGIIMRKNTYKKKFDRDDIISYLATWFSCFKTKFSAICQVLPKSVSENHQVKDIIYEICNHIQPENESGYFELKDESWKYVDPFLPNLGLSQIGSLNDKYLSYLDSNHKPKNCLPCPPLKLDQIVPITGYFCNSCNLHKLLYTVVFNAFVTSPYVTEVLFSYSLYLIHTCVEYTLIKSKEDPRNVEFNASMINDSIILSDEGVPTYTVDNFLVNFFSDVTVTNKSLFLLLLDINSSSKLEIYHNYINDIFENIKNISKICEELINASTVLANALGNLSISENTEKKKRATKSRDAALKRMKLKSEKVSKLITSKMEEEDDGEEEDATKDIKHIEYATCSYCTKETPLYGEDELQFLLIGTLDESYISDYMYYSVWNNNLKRDQNHLFDDETTLSIKYSSFRKIFGCFPSFHYVGCNHYLHRKCFDQLEKSLIDTFTCPACRRKCNFYMDIVNFDEIDKDMRMKSNEVETKFNQKITCLDDLLKYSIDMNRKGIAGDNDLDFICDLFIQQEHDDDDDDHNLEIEYVLDVGSDTKIMKRVYDRSQYKLLLSKCLQMIGSIETLEIAMREDTAIQQSALLFKDGTKIGIKHEHRKLLQLLMNKVFEHNLSCMYYNTEPFSFYFASINENMCHSIISFFFIFLNHLVTSDGIIKACEIASQLAYVFIIYDSLLILHLITPSNIDYMNYPIPDRYKFILSILREKNATFNYKKYMKYSSDYYNQYMGWWESEEKFYYAIKSILTPSIRQMGILTYIIKNNDDSDLPNLTMFDEILDYCQLPRLENILQNDNINFYMNLFCERKKYIHPLFMYKDPLPMMQLPNDIISLFLSLQRFKDNHKDDDKSNINIICLSCGSKMNLSQPTLELPSNGFEQHAVECCGMSFLFRVDFHSIIKTTETQMFLSEPIYCDDFEEEDVKLYRGKRLHLNVNRMNKMRRYFVEDCMSYHTRKYSSWGFYAVYRD